MHWLARLSPLGWNCAVRTKLTVLIALLLAGISGFILVYFPRKVEQQASRAIIDKAQSIAEMTAFSVSPGLFFEDLEGVEDVFAATRENRDLAYIVVVDGSGKVFAAFNRARADLADYERVEEERVLPGDGSIYGAMTPILSGGREIGRLYLGLSLDGLRADVRKSRAAIALVSGIVFTIVMAIVLGISTVVARPLSQMVETVEHINQGDLAQRARVVSQDEVGQLARAFNLMVEHVERSTRELRESEATNRALLESIPDLMFRMDREGRFLDYRARQDDLFMPPDEFLGKKLELVLPEEIAGAAMNGIQRALETGEIQTFEYRIPDGEGWRYHECRVVVSGADEVLGIVRNITQSKEAEEARLRAEEELERQQALSMRSDRLRSLGEMAAGIAHELNQPLSGVRGLAEHILIALQRGWAQDEDKLRQRVERIVEQADRMVHIIEHVRRFAREAGQPELSVVQVNEVVRSAVDLLGAQFRSHGLELACELAEGLPVVRVNPFSLEEVLLNLLSNARDAVEEQRPEDGALAGGRVEVSTTLEGSGPASRVQIEVRDTGVGIPADIMTKVFDPFFTTKDPDKGTGLGLAISRSIVAELDGRLDIQSAVGQGTTVRISLPASGHST